MAIPAMITQMGQQQLNYGMSVGQSLQRLGQQVGQQLAQKEYQRQAAEALPAMQESYRQAFNKIQRGRISEGYMDVLNTGMQFGSNQNPFLMGFIEQANKFAKEAGDVTLSQGWQNIQRGGRAASAMGDVYSVPSTEELLSGTYTQTPTTTSIPAMRGAGGGFSFGGDTRDSIDQDAANNLPQQEPDLGAPISDVPQSAGEGFSFGGGSVSGPSKYQPPAQIIEKAGQEIAAHSSRTPEERREFIDSNTISDYSGKPVSFEGILGYESFSGTQPTQKLGETGRSAQKKYTPKGEEATLKIETGVLNQDEINTFNSTLQNARYASQFVRQNRQLSDIAESVNNDWTRVKTDRSTRNNETTFTASIDNGDPIQLDEEEYKQLSILTTAFPSVMGGFGVKFVKPTEPATERKELFPVKPQPEESAPDMAQGMPAMRQSPLPQERQFSADNPYAETAEPARTAPTKTTKERGSRISLTNRKVSEKLEQVKEQINRIDQFKVGRRSATGREKALRWEELNAEKNRLEQILSQ